MSPFLALILGHILSYIVDHADEIRDAIFDMFPELKGDKDVEQAVNDLTAEPNEARIAALENVIADKGCDAEKLAAAVLNKAEVTV